MYMLDIRNHTIDICNHTIDSDPLHTSIITKFQAEHKGYFQIMPKSQNLKQ